tara:strand:- start:10657 stop:11583 length:927 start_codon:yes stop_codon:yes gene_type:complete
MFSVIFPGQGSQIVGMGKEFYDKFDLVKNLFKEADESLQFPLSKLILEGPKQELDLTLNTQPAIFLISYSIFNVVKNEFNINLNKAKYFAGHSLGEYSALSCAGYLGFSDTLKILRVRGGAMQNSVPKGQGGMVAVLGSTVDFIEKILNDNNKKFKVQIANDNSEGQIVLSGKTEDLDNLTLVLKQNSIKNIKLPVSAPFHCSLMNNATKIMTEELNKLDFKNDGNALISNVTAEEISNIKELKDLLIKQIENRVRWRESIINMIKNDINHFIEIGPGKVLSGLVKRINRDVKINTINNMEDIENLKI